MDKKNKINPDVFIEAIGWLPVATWSCHALRDALPESWCESRVAPAYKFYEAVFQFEWYGRELGGSKCDSSELAVTQRIIALQLAACLITDGFTEEDFK